MKMPRFKVLVELVDFPVQMWRENEVKKAVSTMGLYLGTIPPLKDTDLSCWRLALATDDLYKVAKTVGIVIGGMEHMVQVRPITWEAGAVYKPEDFPVEPTRYTRPPSPRPVSGEASDCDTNSASDDTSELDAVHCSKRALQEICLSITPELIPPEIMSVILGEKNSAAVPFQILKDMVLSDDHAGPLFRNRPPVASDIADRKKSGSRLQHRGLHENIAPNQSSLISRFYSKKISINKRAVHAPG